VYSDSFDKIVRSYFAAVTSEKFVYGGAEFVPKDLRVSPGIFRGFTCPEGCGGCCPRFSLVYLPSEWNELGVVNDHIEHRTVEFSGRTWSLFEDAQTDHDDWHCRNLNKENGRCGIYDARPFSCDFELLRVVMHTRRALLNQQLFGRGWALKRIDGERGALCEMTPPTEYWRDEAARKLRRLHNWTTYFGLETRIPLIVKWVESGPHEEPLFLPARSVPLTAHI